jgi:hypothetical protein
MIEVQGWEVHFGASDILQRFLRFALIARLPNNAIEVARPDGTHQIVEANGVMPEDDMWWQIPVLAAPAFLAAFSKQLGAVEHPAQLRADYEYERNRTTKLLDTITKIAESK